jgi:F-type H+-transporting ATPase subunit alpha
MIFLAFESQLFDFFDANHKDLLDTIVTTKDLPSEDLLDAAIQEFKSSSAFK